MKAAVIAIALMVLLAPTALAGPATVPDQAAPKVTVMTRNVAHGVDVEIGGVVSATGFFDLLQRVTAVYQGYHTRNFPERAAALALEVEATHPALIGLQEAVLVRTQFPADGPATPATTVDLDYVQILIDALAARGLHYAKVVESIGLDVELPSSLGFDVRHTDREVILARTDLRTSDLTLSRRQVGHFVVNCTFPSNLLGPIVLRRGWVSVDARIRGRQFRFISTHLDVDCLPFTSAIQEAQAAEILAGPADTQLPVVIAGDLNSPTDGTGVSYNDVLAAGFSDAWTEAGSGPGLTCCQDSDLLNTTSTLGSRIDLILFRAGAFPHGLATSLTATDAVVVGDDPSDMTASGLWPSDHAGVVATLRLGLP